MVKMLFNNFYFHSSVLRPIFIRCVWQNRHGFTITFSQNHILVYSVISQIFGGHLCPFFRKAHIIPVGTQIVGMGRKFDFYIIVQFEEFNYSVSSANEAVFSSAELTSNVILLKVIFVSFVSRSSLMLSFCVFFDFDMSTFVLL